MKTKLTYLFFVLLLVVSQATALAAEPQFSFDVQVSEYAVLFDLAEISMPTYVIEGKVCTPLKTITEFFGVYSSFDDGVITIETAIPDGGDERLATLEEHVKVSGRKALPSPHEVYFQEQQIDMEMLLVEGHNFLNVEDIEWLFGCIVKIDDEKNIVRISRDPLAVYDDEYLEGVISYLATNAIPMDMFWKRRRTFRMMSPLI